jgi:hypothetical protein
MRKLVFGAAQVSRAHCIRLQTPAPSPKKLAKPDRHGGRYGLALLDNIVKVLAGDTQESGDLGLGPAGRRYHLLA